MYLPASFAENNRESICQWVSRHPLGLLITHGASGLQASPLPFWIEESGSDIRLHTHMARANPHWKEVLDAQTCLVTFQGAHGYVTPSWYPSKATTHQVVPTWNYAMVQMRGKPHLRDDAAWLRQQVSRMTDHMEHTRAQPWSVQDAPEAFVATQLKAIVGIEIEVTDMQGKWKMSQNRSVQDAQGVVDGLSDPNDPHAHAEVAASVADRLRKR